MPDRDELRVTHRIGRLLGVLVPESEQTQRERASDRFDLLAAIVYMQIYWDINTTNAPLSEPHMRLDSLDREDYARYWQLYVERTSPLFKVLHGVQTIWMNASKTRWSSRELELITIANQRLSHVRADPMLELCEQATFNKQSPVTLANTSTLDYTLTRLSKLPPVIINHVRAYADHAEDTLRVMARLQPRQDTVIFQQLCQSASEALVRSTVASGSITSAIGKGATFKHRFQEVVKRVYYAPATNKQSHSAADTGNASIAPKRAPASVSIPPSLVGYITPVILGDSLHTTESVQFDHLLSVLEIAETAAGNGYCVDWVSMVDPDVERACDMRRILHPALYTFLCLETLYIEQSALPLLPAGDTSRIFWDVMTGAPIRTGTDGFYQTHFFRSHCPITIVLSYAQCESSRIQMAKWHRIHADERVAAHERAQPDAPRPVAPLQETAELARAPALLNFAAISVHLHARLHNTRKSLLPSSQLMLQFGKAAASAKKAAPAKATSSSSSSSSASSMPRVPPPSVPSSSATPMPVASVKRPPVIAKPAPRPQSRDDDDDEVDLYTIEEQRVQPVVAPPRPAPAPPRPLTKAAAPPPKKAPISLPGVSNKSPTSATSDTSPKKQLPTPASAPKAAPKKAPVVAPPVPPTPRPKQAQSTHQPKRVQPIEPVTLHSEEEDEDDEEDLETGFVEVPSAIAPRKKRPASPLRDGSSNKNGQSKRAKTSEIAILDRERVHQVCASLSQSIAELCKLLSGMPASSSVSKSAQVHEIEDSADEFDFSQSAVSRDCDNLDVEERMQVENGESIDEDDMYSIDEDDVAVDPPRGWEAYDEEHFYHKLSSIMARIVKTKRDAESVYRVGSIPYLSDTNPNSLLGFAFSPCTTAATLAVVHALCDNDSSGRPFSSPASLKQAETYMNYADSGNSTYFSRPLQTKKPSDPQYRIWTSLATILRLLYIPDIQFDKISKNKHHRALFKKVDFIDSIPMRFRNGERAEQAKAIVRDPSIENYVHLVKLFNGHEELLTPGTLIHEIDPELGTLTPEILKCIPDMTFRILCYLFTMDEPDEAADAAAVADSEMDVDQSHHVESDGMDVDQISDEVEEEPKPRRLKKKSNVKPTSTPMEVDIADEDVYENPEDSNESSSAVDPDDLLPPVRQPSSAVTVRSRQQDQDDLALAEELADMDEDAFSGDQQPAAEEEEQEDDDREPAAAPGNDLGDLATWSEEDKEADEDEDSGAGVTPLMRGESANLAAEAEYEEDGADQDGQMAADEAEEVAAPDEVADQPGDVDDEGAAQSVDEPAEPAENAEEGSYENGDSDHVEAPPVEEDVDDEGYAVEPAAAAVEEDEEAPAEVGVEGQDIAGAFGDEAGAEAEERGEEEYQEQEQGYDYGDEEEEEEEV